jgi:hypothetical protein
MMTVGPAPTPSALASRVDVTWQWDRTSLAAQVEPREGVIATRR